MSELVLREDREGLAILTLNRPEALNALSPSLFVELRGHVDDIAQDIDNVGCVLLRGEGRSFSAGNDLKAIQARGSGRHEHFGCCNFDKDSSPEDTCRIHVPRRLSRPTPACVS